jgi:hypothetical protein
MKLTITIRPTHTKDVGDIFELRAATDQPPRYDARWGAESIFLTRVDQPVIVTFDDGLRSLHLPLRSPLEERTIPAEYGAPIQFPGDPQPSTEDAQGGQAIDGPGRIIDERNATIEGLRRQLARTMKAQELAVTSRMLVESEFVGAMLRIRDALKLPNNPALGVDEFVAEIERLRIPEVEQEENRATIAQAHPRLAALQSPENPQGPDPGAQGGQDSGR